MPAIILIIALVCLPLIVGACLATAGYKSYHTRRLLECDVEQAQNANGTRHTIEMRDLESSRTHRSWPLSASHPVSVAPVAKPRSHPKLEIKRIGGGCVEHYGGNGASEEKYEHARSHGSEKTKSNDHFENADLYAGPAWQWNTSHPQQHSLHPENNATTDIPAPQPIYTSTLYGRYNSTASPTTMMYGDDTKAAEVWEKIERHESLVGKRGSERVEQPMKVHGEDFEDVDLNGGTEEWR
jgi:hypothetical protein